MTKKFFLFLFFIPLFSVAQHTISGTFTPAENYRWGIVYRVTPSGTEYTTDTKIDEKGAFTMTLDSIVVGGIFRFVYGVPPEEHNFEFIYSGKEDIILSFSEEDGLIFITSDENIKWTLYRQKIEEITVALDYVYNNSSPDERAVTLLFELQRETQRAFEELSTDLLVGKLIRASRSYIPDEFEIKETYLQHKKENYFKHIDITEEILQQSTFLFEQTYKFIEGNTDLDVVAEFLQPAEKEYQRSLFLNIWEQLVIDNRIEAANYLGRNYLLPIAKALNDLALVDKLLKFESLSPGAIAPDFSWEGEDDQTHWFYDLQGSENYILVFWSSNCSHCLNELPKLQNAIQSIPEGKYKVVAFGLEDDIYNWKNEILRLPEFLHIPGLGKWENKTGNAYDVSMTPTYFVLDKNKRIMAKPEELETLIDLITVEQ